MVKDIKTLAEKIRNIKKDSETLNIQDKHLLKQIVGKVFGLVDKEEFKKSILDSINRE